MPQVLPTDVRACPLAHAEPRPQLPVAGRGWLGSRAERAIWHTLVLAAFALVPGCDGESTTTAAGGTPKERIDRLVALLTPLSKTVTSDKTDQQFIAGKELTAQLSAAGPEVGRAALDKLREVPNGQRPQAVERGLLTVAAHAAPEDSRVLLENLVTQYGTDLALRTEATLLLADVHPKRALALLEPFVRKARQSQTLPPQEFLVRAYTTACEKTGTDPVPALADAAANMFMDETARVRCVKELANHPESQLAEKTLAAILIESTGDGYLRRMAVQGLIKILPRESACALLTQVADKEADTNMLLFLRDALDKYCKQ